MSKIRVLTLLMLLVGLAGCETTSGPSIESSATAVEPATEVFEADIQTLVARANRANPPRSIELWLTAAERAIERGVIGQAMAILNRVDAAEYPHLYRRYIYARAEVAVQLDDPVAALDLLRHPSLSKGALTQEDQIHIAHIRASAYQKGRSYLASARELIFINDLLSADERNLNHERIFATLLELPHQTLTSQAERAITSDIRGWLSLAALVKRDQNDPLEQLISLNQWKQVWSHHPAASRLPASLQLLSRIVEERPESIALLLPLYGDLGPYGRAIRDGLLAAHMATGSGPVIKVYDTTSASLRELISRAHRDGAELIIGPLQRDHVTALMRISLPVPVLALNRSVDDSANANVYQFGLAPEDEVQQVARQVFMEGRHKALVLYADSEWGHRNFETFRRSWDRLGGTLVDAAAFPDQRDYSDLVKSLLDVDESEARAAELRRITGRTFEFTPRRREDIDFVFLLANTSQARRLNPTLAFFYADDIPVYATSHIHEFSDSRIESIDLNGIRFCDIPWKLTATDRVQQKILDNWLTSRQGLAPFFALGVDAYHLFPRLQQLRELPDSRIFGTTGVLQLDSLNVIKRELMWAQFVDGQAVSAPLVLDVSDR